jgi:hypothetical protein
MSTTTSYFGKIMVALLGTAMLGTAVRADIIYDNTTTSLGQYTSETGEFGDQINFAGTARDLTDFQFQYYLGSATGGATADLKIYDMTGTPITQNGNSYAAPGNLLYDSTAIPIQVGAGVFDVSQVSLTLPDTVTWTVSFNAGTNIVGLLLANPPSVGSSLDDFWVNNNGTWELHSYNGSPVANFAAQVSAVPEPSVVEFGMMAGLAGLGWLSMRRRSSK